MVNGLAKPIDVGVGLCSIIYGDPSAMLGFISLRVDFLSIIWAY